MIRNFIKKNFISLLLFVLIFISVNVNAQISEREHSHAVTLYIMPTMYPLDWSSPSALYKTMKECYLKTIGLPDNYLLGHLAVRLESSLLDKPILMAQTSGTVQEKTDLILKQKVGFGIMGAALTGRIETEKELNHKLNVYAKRQKLAFLKYRISEKAMYRILTFIDKYKQKINAKNAACDFYGGAFWPRYQNEGGGCTTFGFALLDLVNALTPETEKWRMELKIPTEIIGGEFNNGKKIKNTTIKRTKSWFEKAGTLNEDYVKYLVYEPSIMFDWILENRTKNIDGYIASDEAGVPGVIIDKRSAEFDENEPLFISRPEPNKFIDVYYKKIGL
jgi:hypothetical protein